MKSSLPLKGFLSLQLGVAAVLPVIVIAVLIWVFWMPVIQSRTGLRHQAMARSIAGQVSAHLEGGERQLTALAEYLREGEPDSYQGLVGLLDAQCGNGELFEALFIVDDQNRRVQTVGLAQLHRPNRADYTGLEFSGHSFIRYAGKQQQAAWSKLFLSTVTNRMTVALTAPLANGFIIGEITLDKLSEVITDLPVESALLVFVIDGQGHIVADSQNQHTGQLMDLYLHDADKIDSKTLIPSDFFKLKDEQMLGTVVDMDGLDWKVLIAQPTRNAFGPIRDTFRLIALGLVITLGITIIFSWFQASHLSNLFQAYAQKAKSIAEGHYTLDWPKARTKEFILLGQSLQRMAEKISLREMALVESERRLQEITANVPGVVIQFRSGPDHEYTNEYFSAKITEIFGLKPDSLTILDEFNAGIPDADQEAYAASKRAAIDSVGPWTYEGRFIRPDGDTIWFSGHALPRIEGDTIVYYGILLDITERKQTEEALHLAQFIVDSAAIGIQIIQPGGRLRSVNPCAAKMLGYTIEEALQLSVWDFDASIDKHNMNSVWERLSNLGTEVFESTHTRKDGSLISVEVATNFVEYDSQPLAVAFVQDITERKRIEKALKESEERLDLALSSANEGIWDWRIEPNILYLDSRYYTMAGYEPNEFPASFDELLTRVHKDDLEQVISYNEHYMAGTMDAFDVEFRFLRKDGEYMWIQAKGEFVAWDVDGKPTRFIGTNADISRRKLAEVALRENEQLLNNILESMTEGILVLDKDFKYTIFNKALEAIAGKHREDVIGRRPWDVFPNIRSSPTEENIKKAMNGKASGSLEVSLLLPDNTSAWFRDSFSPLEDVNGNIIGVVGVVSDIARQKQDEEELRRLQNYLSNIIDSMPSILVAVDHDGNVTQWNSKTAQTTGLSFEDVRSKPLPKVFPRLADEMERIRTSIRDRRVISSPKASRKPDKASRFEDITIFPLVANGVEGAVIRVDDVTEQVRLEEMMIQSEKMLSVGGLAAGMAHEINNPLAGILQTAVVMANRLGSRFYIPANRKAAEAAGTTMEAIDQFMTSRGIPRMLATIAESGQRVAAIVDNMLSFARKGEASISSHNLGTLLDKTTELAATDYDLKKQYDFKRIEIVKEYAPDVPEVPCEGAKIQQVLLNILRNGAQAMQAAGTESPRFIYRTWFDSKRQLAVIEIEDNGPGLDEQTRKRVFEPFFTTKPVGVGTGLGLSVSYFIVTENHGGEMAVESRPGAGAKFIIRLPIDDARNHGGDL